MSATWQRQPRVGTKHRAAPLHAIFRAAYAGTPFAQGQRAMLDDRATDRVRLRRCQRGAVSAEYLMIVGVCALSLAVTLVGLGPSVVRSWAYSRHVLYGRAP